MSEKMREEFEAAYLKDVAERFSGAEVDDDEWFARGSNGEYRSCRAAGAWWAWQASRDVLVIDLQKIYPDCYCPSTATAYREDCKKSIEAAGLKVKP